MRVWSWCDLENKCAWRNPFSLLSVRLQGGHTAINDISTVSIGYVITIENKVNSFLGASLENEPFLQAE